MESKYYSPYCTKCKVDLAPHEGHRSRIWVHCDACHIKEYPAAAKRKGLIKELPAKPVKPVKAQKPVKPVQLALFEIPNHTLPPCDCTGAFSSKEELS